MIKKISIRISGLLLLVTVLNFIYTYTLFKKDLENTCHQAIEIKDKQESSDVFYFAESSNNDTQLQDSIRNTISEITNFFFPKLKGLH